MRLNNKNSVFNMGDTSIRVKQIVEVNKVILNKLHKHNQQKEPWSGNQESQENFYRKFIEDIVSIEKEDNIELFSDFKRYKNYELPPKGKLGLRGRTLTNNLVKSGLINEDRVLSESGLNYLNEYLNNFDPIEKLLEFSVDNLVYFRQFLKLRIYSSSSDKYFYNFRFALKFLSKYNDVPQNDFLTIIETIRPTQSEEEINNLIEDYQDVVDGKMIFNEFYNMNFTDKLISIDEIYQAKNMFINEDYSNSNFKKLFPNAKNSETSLLYKEFVLALINFKKNRTYENLTNLISLSNDSKIKKAFSSGKRAFEYNRKMTLEEFISKNEENSLLSDNNFEIYLEFVFSKHKDLIREYSDMCKRTFEITGAISFENGLVNLNNSWIFQPIIEELGTNFNLTGNDSYSDYEKNLNSIWFQDISTETILGITSLQRENIFKNIAQRFDTSDLTTISESIFKKREQEYREFIYTNFPKQKVIDILENIIKRNDSDVYSSVTDKATVPTIFEYILTIAWFHLSKNKNYSLHQSFGVSLDGNKLPLVHKGGGSGDIEIIDDSYSLLIEATLMDKNTQRRAELEPVIRHSINFSITQDPKSSNTIFIANELDNNVINIFRATQFINLNGTLDSKLNVSGLNIFALTTNELINLLANNIYDIDIIDKINRNLDNYPVIIKNDWRNEILGELIVK